MTGSLVTRTVQDQSGQHDTFYLDISGTGAGPFIPVSVGVDANGSVIAGAGGGPATVADGADVTQGAKADAAAASPAVAASSISILKGLWATLRGTVTVQGAAGGTPQPVAPAVGTAADASANPATIASLTTAGAVLLKTLAATTSGYGLWLAQQQAATTAWVVLDDGTSSATDGSDSTRTVLVLDPAAAANRQGGTVGYQDTGPHLGRIRIYGAAGAQVALRRQ